MLKIIKKYRGLAVVIAGFAFNFAETAYFGFNMTAGSQAEVIADYVAGLLILVGLVVTVVDVYRLRPTSAVDVCRSMVGHSYYVITGKPLYTVITVLRVTDDDRVVYVVCDEQQLRTCRASMFTVNARFLPMTDKVPVIDERFTVMGDDQRSAHD